MNNSNKVEILIDENIIEQLKLNLFSPKNLEDLINLMLKTPPIEWISYKHISITDFHYLDEIQKNNLVKLILVNKSKYKICILKMFLTKEIHLNLLSKDNINKLMKLDSYFLRLLSKELLNDYCIIKESENLYFERLCKYTMKGSTFNDLYSEINFSGIANDEFFLKGGGMKLQKSDKDKIKLYINSKIKNSFRIKMNPTNIIEIINGVIYIYEECNIFKIDLNYKLNGKEIVNFEYF